MKMTLVFLIFILSLSVNSQVKPEATSPRQVKIINSNWTFNYFPSGSAEKGYEAPFFDDSKWTAVSVPHTWNTYETTGELPQSVKTGVNGDVYWRNGWGWYRKHFSINQSYSEKKVFIEFGGVMNYCKVWINGVYLGDHKGGYGAFDFEITRHVKKGADNVIAVAVNNKMGKGDYYVYGGILQDVSIVLKNNLYIPMQGSASHEGGTFVTTPGFNGKTGTVRILTWVKNENEQLKSCVLQTTIYDEDGKIVQQLRSTAELKKDQLYTFDQTSKPLKNPHAWSTDDPYLYKVVSEVYDGKTLADYYTSPLGFRWFKWNDNENCLYLNSKKILFRPGRNIEYPLLGSALPGWIRSDQYAALSEKMKCNYFRTDGYLNDNILYDISDRLGIIIEETVPDVSPDLRPQLITEMIRSNRNHPSVMIRSTSDIKPASELAEDTTRIFRTGIAGKPNVLSFGTFSNTDKALTMPVSFSGEPARIILTSLQSGFPADRSSVAIIHSDIFDPGGKSITGAAIKLKWIITGPAKLVGPAITRNDTNAIRSTGEPGTIKVKVFAAGLASGSVEIKSEALKQENNVISEPVLKNDGRTGVDPVKLRASRMEEIPREIKPVTDPMKFSSRDKDGYKKAIRESIAANNPSIDTSTVEFRALVDILTLCIYNNNGQIAAEDFNFNAEHFNLCRLIAGYVTATKIPQPFKDGLRNYYSGSIIKEGDEKNAGNEMNWLNWIPSGGTVVYSLEHAASPAIKGTLVTSSNVLTDLITLVHPQFSKFSEDARARAIEFIAKMNPFVHPDNQTGTTLVAERGKPVLIPLFKFIAE